MRRDRPCCASQYGLRRAGLSVRIASRLREAIAIIEKTAAQQRARPFLGSDGLRECRDGPPADGLCAAALSATMGSLVRRLAL